MSLVVHLTVTDREHLLTVEIRRTEPLTADRDHYTYEVTLHGTGNYMHGSRQVAVIEHTYSAGAIPLAVAGLQAAQAWLDTIGVPL